MAPNEYPESEGMQVVPPHEGLQVVQQQHGLEVVPSQGLESIEKKKDDTAAYQGIEVANEHLRSPEKIEKTRYKRVCGLTYRAFAIVIVVLVAVIVAAVVGGVVGSRKSTSNNDSSPDSSGSTSTDSSPTKTGSQTTTAPHSAASSAAATVNFGPVPTTPLKLDCPAINNTTRTIKSERTGVSYEFDVFCNANWAPGNDLGIQNTTTFDDCIQACIIMQEISVKDGPCTGAVWDSVLNLALEGQKRNCFLKNGSSVKDWGDDPDFSEYPKTHPAAAIFAPNGGRFS
ncbi:hypothetical protein V495_04485 [Pseudogymnoascus sp. VKM F-4514 (FW-929)]|nr:hypothetical protein V495_04485 [Pseudogymnoascus sp. VKM F-4514 (FW-929)]KFY54716.1 hypothetical protein V497_07494 [Pseudogymnoascus sp. VKM F-4516 (FW-969)]